MIAAQKIPKVLRIAVSGTVLFLFGLSFVSAGTGLGLLPHWQFAPSVLRLCGAFSIGAAVFVAAVVLISLLFGRVYCAAFCPLGIFQDFILFLAGSGAKGKHAADHPVLRYGIAGLTFGLLAGGWTAGFLLLDPYSNAGRIFTAWFSAGGAIALTVVILLAVWKKRMFCTSVCPVGTLLGLLSKKSVFRLAVSDECVRCGLCAVNCRAGCIAVSPAGVVIDGERCVRCMDCAAVCPKHAIRLAGPAARKSSSVPSDPSRRRFLIHGAVLAGAAVLGFGLGRAGFFSVLEKFSRFRILPPGAGDPARFASKCTACQLCVMACPEKIITFARGGDGPVSLDLSHGACRFDCVRCSEVCPTGAIVPLTLAVKQKTKIAEARFDPTRCRVFQEGEPCGLCAGACPVHAVTLRKNGTPKPVNTDLCIGCGACAKVCPVTPVKAMTVHEIEKQIVLNS